MAVPVPAGPFVPPHQIGEHQGNSGTRFTLNRFSSGHIVKRIGVHFSTTNLRGLNISYSDGTRQTTGALQGSYAEITLQPAEVVTRASIWGEGQGRRTGRIWLETSRGQTLNAGRNTAGQDEFPINVGSGILAGFLGRSSTEIWILGFLFILPVTRTLISNVRFTLPAGDTIGSQLFREATYENVGTSGDINWDFSNSVTRTNSVSFSSSATVEFGSSISITAGIPAIAQVESSFSWSVSATATWQRTNETQLTFGWGLSGSLAPGDTVQGRALCQHGQADLEYTATVRHEFASHNPITYTDRGVLECSEYAFATASARPGKIRGHVQELEDNKNQELAAEKQIKSRL